MGSILPTKLSRTSRISSRSDRLCESHSFIIIEKTCKTLYLPKPEKDILPWQLSNKSRYRKDACHLDNQGLVPDPFLKNRRWSECFLSALRTTRCTSLISLGHPRIDQTLYKSFSRFSLVCYPIQYHQHLWYIFSDTQSSCPDSFASSSIGRLEWCLECHQSTVNRPH